MSRAPITALLTMKKMKHVVSGTNRRMRNVSNVLQAIIESIRIHSAEF